MAKEGVVPEHKIKAKPVPAEEAKKEQWDDAQPYWGDLDLDEFYDDNQTNPDGATDVGAMPNDGFNDTDPGSDTSAAAAAAVTPAADVPAAAADVPAPAGGAPTPAGDGDGDGDMLLEEEASAEPTVVDESEVINLLSSKTQSAAHSDSSGKTKSKSSSGGGGALARQGNVKEHITILMQGEDLAVVNSQVLLRKICGVDVFPDRVSYDFERLSPHSAGSGNNSNSSNATATLIADELLAEKVSRPKPEIVDVSVGSSGETSVLSADQTTDQTTDDEVSMIRSERKNGDKDASDKDASGLKYASDKMMRRVNRHASLEVNARGELEQ